LAYSKLPLIRVHLFGYIFSPALLPTLGVLFFFPLLVTLGIWQLHRAAAKQVIEQEYLNQEITSIATLQNPQNRGLHYRRLQAKGFFDTKHVIFLDNKTYHQKVGYHVFSPFIVNKTKQTLLVDRGFIAINCRKTIPLIPPPPRGEQLISGFIYFPSRAFLLKKEIPQNHWPRIVQAINLEEIGKSLHKNIYPFYLLLYKGENSGLIRDWNPVNFPSYRHIGYAIQWFLLALTLIIIYLILNTSKAY
jgi:surfeit locus 1 family protein